VAAYVSQIHLTHKETGARTIVHIGAAVRSSDREVLLVGNGHPRLRLRFTQAGGDDDSPVMIECLGIEPPPGAPPPTEPVDFSVDNRGATLNMAGNPTIGIKHGSLLTIGKGVYHCELLTLGYLPPPQIQSAWQTVIGPVQDHNEDALGIYRGKRAQLFALADGVGGAEAGERMSEFAIKWLLTAFHVHRTDDEVDWLQVMRAAFQAINSEVWHFSRLSAAPSGTTLTAVVLQGWDAYVSHVGDSRLYLWNGISLRQLTTDHVTFISERVGANPLNKGRVITTRRAVLDRGIGKGATIDPEQFQFRLNPNDRLLLVSDGLYNRMNDDEIADVIRDTSILSLPQRLVTKANERFNDDNLSVIAVRVITPQGIRERSSNRVESMPRVYVGYRRGYRARLKATEELNTNPIIPFSYRARLWLRKRATRGNFIRLSLLLALVFVMVWWINRDRSEQIAASVTATVRAAETRAARTPTANAALTLPASTLVSTATQPAPSGSGGAESADPTSSPTITLQPFPTITLPPEYRRSKSLFSDSKNDESTS